MAAGGGAYAESSSDYVHCSAVCRHRLWTVIW